MAFNAKIPTRQASIKLLVFLICFNFVFILGFSLKNTQAIWFDVNNSFTLDDINVSSPSGSSDLDNYVTGYALNSQNIPYIVWIGIDTITGDLNAYFSKWTVGTGWTKMDGTAGADQLTSLTDPNNAQWAQIIMHNDIPYISINVQNATTDKIYVTKWTAGTGWTRLDGVTVGAELVLTTSKNNDDPKDWDFKVSSNGNPYIVKTDSALATKGTYIIKYTAGIGWTHMDGTTLGAENLDVSQNNSAKIQLDSHDRPYLVWTHNFTASIYFTRWNGSSWVKMDGTAGSETISYGAVNRRPYLVLGSNNLPYAVWLGYPDGGLNVQAIFRKWTPGTGWTSMDSLSAYDSLTDYTAGNFSQFYEITKIVLGQSDNPYVLWADKHSYLNVFLSKWAVVSSEWTTMAGTAGYENITNISDNNSIIYKADLALAANDTPYVIYDMENPDSFNVYLTKYNADLSDWTYADNETLGAENISNTLYDPNYDNAYEGILILRNQYFPDVVFTKLDSNIRVNGADVYFLRWLDTDGNFMIVDAIVEPTLTLSLSSPLCNFDPFSSSVIKTCNYSTTISTNGTSGYIAYIRAQGALSSGANTFPDVTGGYINAGTEEYGIATSDTDFASLQINKQITDCASLNDSTDPVNAAILSTNDQSFAFEAGPIASDVVALCHAASITGTTPAGNYSHTVVLTATGNF